MMITCGLKATCWSVPSTPRARSSGLTPDGRSAGHSGYPLGMPQVQQLSQDAYDRLAAEFQDLTTRGRINIARKIETARELGDLSENGDYHAAKEEQGKMEGRILHLESILENSEIVELTAGSIDVVAPGTVVAIVFEGDDQPERMLVGSIEEKRDDVGVVSPGSPLGEALLGAAVGDTVSFEAPGGTLAVEVVAIER